MSEESVNRSERNATRLSKVWCIDVVDGDTRSKGDRGYLSQDGFEVRNLARLSLDVAKRAA